MNSEKYFASVFRMLFLIGCIVVYEAMFIVRMLK